MILCHTPLKDHVKTYENKYVLFSGLGDTVSVFEDYGFKKGIDIEELLALHPEMNPLTKSWYPESKLEAKKKQVLARLDMTEEELKNDLAFDAIMVFADVNVLELSL